MTIDPLLRGLLPGFVAECEEISERVTVALLAIERAGDAGARRDAVDEVARGLHTIKGSAGSLGLDDVSSLAHRLEDAAAALRGQADPPPAGAVDRLLTGLDRLMGRLRAHGREETPAPLAQDLAIVEGAAPTTVEEPAAATAAEDLAGAWRVRPADVTLLLRDVDRLRELRLRLEARRREVERAAAALPRSAETAEARALLGGLARALRSDAEHMGDVQVTVEDAVRTIGTLPLRSALDPLQRAVRDLCRQLGKSARLSVAGAEVSIDRRVLAALTGPLSQLVRNAVDHGIEAPAERERRGKDGEGLITIRAEQVGNALHIEVQDDGDGIDAAAVGRRAVELGLLDADALAALPEAAVLDLMFEHGLTTREEVTGTSGRGIGLDIVRAQVRGLGGRIEVWSRRGQGSTFALTLPVELGSSPLLVVSAGELRLGIPMADVEGVLAARDQDLRVGPARVEVAHRDELLPLHDLAQLLGLRDPLAPRAGQPLLVVRWQAQRVLVAVDAVVGHEELVVRPLPSEVRGVTAYQGVATLAHGELLLVLRAPWLVERPADSARRLEGRRALVVDDSLTARASHRAVLESGGFLVHAVADAAQARAHLGHGRYDVLVCDVALPGEDGLTLAAALRGRPETRRLPIVLVSARDAPADRERGLAAGADAFVGKRECAAGKLLAEVGAAIRRQARGGVVGS